MKHLIEKQAAIKTKPELIFQPIADNRGWVWLDSSLHISDKGRYSFIARNPVTEISSTIEALEESIDRIQNLCSQKNLFAIGYLTYETGLYFLDLKIANSPLTPLLHFFLYESVLQFDNVTKHYIASNPIIDDYSDLFDETFDSPAKESSTAAKVTETVPKDVYLRRVNEIQNHIKEGDIYQANYTCRFDVESKIRPFAVYNRLRDLNPAPYAAFLNFGEYQIISSSPERMFKMNGEYITSCPIKGTVPSGNSEVERKLQQTKLLNSDKDKAELLMIVDLMRNDIGKIAETGSVEVNNLFAPEAYSSVIHLVADVSARLRSKVTIKDIFAALIPGGSITGAPKKRAVEILQNFETTPRGIYTGCIGYINGTSADFNIAIRTIVHSDGIYNVHAGGGIVADSDPESEYNEMQLKARNLFKALGVTDEELYA